MNKPYKLQFNSRRYLVNAPGKKELSQFSRSTKNKQRSLERIVSKRTFDKLSKGVHDRRFSRDEIILQS